MTKRTPQRGCMIVDLDGFEAELPLTSCIAYLAQVFANSGSPYPTHSLAATAVDDAWRFVRNSIANGGHGHVLIYDLTIYGKPPKLLKCLGRIDNPRMEPIIP